MLSKIIIWLATKFLSSTQITQLFADTEFKTYYTGAIRNVFQLTGTNANHYALGVLNTQFTHDEISYINALLVLRNNFIGQPEAFNVFLAKLSELAAGKNSLKALKEIQALVRENAYHVDDKTCKSIANAIYIQGPVSSEAASYFLKEI